MNEKKRQPKYKSELRQAIGEDARAIKNIYVLRQLYIITDILKRYCDEEAYKTLTDNEWDIIVILNNIISHRESRKLSAVKAFISGYFSPGKKRRIHEEV